MIIGSTSRLQVTFVLSKFSHLPFPEGDKREAISECNYRTPGQLVVNINFTINYLLWFYRMGTRTPGDI